MTAAYLTRKQLADHLGVSESFIKQHDPLPGRVLVGRLIRYHLPEIERALRSPGGLTRARARK